MWKFGTIGVYCYKHWMPFFSKIDFEYWANLNGLVMCMCMCVMKCDWNRWIEYVRIAFTSKVNNFFMIWIHKMALCYWKTHNRLHWGCIRLHIVYRNMVSRLDVALVGFRLYNNVQNNPTHFWLPRHWVNGTNSRSKYIGKIFNECTLDNYHSNSQTDF